MRDILARTGRSRHQPRARSAVRLRVERLENRELLATLAPSGLTATGISASAIALKWNAPPDPTVTGYDVIAKTFVVAGGGKGSHSGHYVYQVVATNLATTADTITGLVAGSTHSYVVTALGPGGMSGYSAPATAETWFAPRFSNGPNIFLLSSGALWSGPVNATAGLTTQLSLLVGGNPLTFSVVSGPSTASIDPKSGVVTYTPSLSTVGTVNITFRASNPLGSITQTIAFNVAASNPKLLKPTLKLYTPSLIYTGQYQQISVAAVAANGVTPVPGIIAIAYNGSNGFVPNAGTYQVLLTFTSLDPRYSNATLLTNLTITKATPAFNYLTTSPTIAVGTAATVVSGSISAFPAVPAGDYVTVTVHGVSQQTTVNANGNFVTSLATGALPVGTYPVTYSFAGDSNFNAVTNGTSTLTVLPLAPPQVTLQPPLHVTTTAGDGVTLTATATGTPVPTVQWQVSTDGGKTFNNVTGNTSALTSTFSFISNTGENGYEYRAVFTNEVSTATSTIVTLKVETDTGGGGD
jgi:hypothetical protein